MIQAAQIYIHSILYEKSWSWMIAAGLFMIMGHIIQIIVFGPVKRRAKALGKTEFGLFKKFYFRRCFLGWVFFYISVAFAVSLWLNVPKFPLSLGDFASILSLAISFLLSLIFHLMALGSAALKLVARHQEVVNNTHAYQKNYPVS